MNRLRHAIYPFLGIQTRKDFSNLSFFFSSKQNEVIGLKKIWYELFFFKQPSIVRILLCREIFHFHKTSKLYDNSTSKFIQINSTFLPSSSFPEKLTHPIQNKPKISYYPIPIRFPWAHCMNFEIWSTFFLFFHFTERETK